MIADLVRALEEVWDALSLPRALPNDFTPAIWQGAGG
jgi:hypothetical protein